MYFITNRTVTNESVSCFSISQGVLIHVYSPNTIVYHNNNMGGDDIAYMRKLYFNSMVMGLYQWWLKLFFIYLELELLMTLYFTVISLKKVEKNN